MTSPSTAPLLSAALERVRQVGGLPVAFGGQMVAEPSHVVLEHVLGGRTDAIRGLRIGVGRGLGVLSHDLVDTRLMGVAPMPVWMRSVL